MNGDSVGETYRVIKVDGKVVEILAMTNAASMEFGPYRSYAASTLDNYLNNTWYNTLSSIAKAAIVDKTFSQDSWYPNDSGNPDYSGYYGSSNPGTTAYTISLGNASFKPKITRHVYALSVQDVLNYVLDTNITDGNLQNYNIWKMFWNRTTQISEDTWLCSGYELGSMSISFYVRGNDGKVHYDYLANNFAARPAMQIDLSKINFTIME